ncbi:hypothetical protein PV04_09659 [Phialophora macrospora]|uniref:Zn(2)-C6 fungal-type domain-containing protein n=1 Tax=Phialophora macrospora TaxID=1851006 RepID=A0A0D2F9Q5_9EURO|nr:hypothetical protein PV04_09659 [Phialophora macrospora]
MQCDGVSPQCTQCSFGGRICPGYPRDLTIIQHQPEATSYLDSAHRSHKLTGTFASPACSQSSGHGGQHTGGQRQPYLDPSALESATYEELSKLIIENYVPKDELLSLACNPIGPHARICGSWVEVLLKMDRPGKHYDVLFAALRTLCLTFVQRSRRDEKEYVHTYCAVLSALRNALILTSSAFEPDSAAASMCLTLCEVMLPTSATGWMAHVKGVGELIRSRGPGMLLDNINQSLFLGFRPLIIIEAFYSRRSTFLSSSEWLELPFSDHPATPMQSLLSHAVAIPALLEQIEAAQREVPLDSQAHTTKIHDAFVQVSTKLEHWERSLLQTMPTPVYWPVPSPEHTTSSLLMPRDSVSVPNLHFSDISAANAYIHFWAFQIVCLTQLHTLRSSPYLGLQPRDLATPPKPKPFEDHVRQTILCLSTKICQSMAYLMREDMRLYGPASTFYPLKVVHETLMADPITQTSEQVAWCRCVVAVLVDKGLGLADAMIR